MARVNIGEAARRTGLTIKALRFYEAQGLIPLAVRQGVYRTYSEPDLVRLAFLKEARDFGFTLAELRTVMQHAFEPGHCDRVYGLIEQRRAQLQQQAQALQDQLAALDRLQQRLRASAET